ncbi:MAG: hypothetical protein D6830_04885, partial [Ignavibacteria bacterium]
IQPEGNTERLEELDKVFIQIIHPNAEGVFGDYELNSDVGEFGKLNRKLQGLKGKVNYSTGESQVAFASARGKFNSQLLSGKDGVQGPYRLTGANNEKDIIVIAGSEKVYVDGVLMKRGENNDYVIEYANAELYFTPKVLITSASRITVDFEYTDRRYQRSFFAFNNKTEIIKNRLSISASYITERDNQDNPVDLILSEEDKNILMLAGNDRNKAVRSGVTLVEPDSNGVRKGIYTKIDTVINNKNYSYYLFAPGSTNSIYNVVFNYVGIGEGDYKKISTGNFKFVGIGRGDYLPLYFIPMPERHDIANILLKSEWNGIEIGAELAGSNYDKNRFSNLDDENNYGYAANLTMGMPQRSVNLFNKDLGKFGLNIRHRYIDKKFSSIDRINSIEYNRDYNIPSVTNSNESLTEINLSYLPDDRIALNSTYGRVNKGDRFNSKRINSTLDINNLNGIKGRLNLDIVNSSLGLVNTDWIRSVGSFNFNIWGIEPGLDYLYENKNEGESTDSLFNSSLRYIELIPKLSLLSGKHFNLSAKYSYREEHFPINGILFRESIARSEILALNYTPGKSLRANLDITVRNKKFNSGFATSSKLDNQTILFRSDNRFNLFDKFFTGNIFYQTATERTSKLEKVFVRVPVGTGNYIYLGDLNNNGIADEEEFEQSIYDADYILTTIPTDELFPVITLKTNFRWRLNFERLTKEKSIWGKILSSLSTESVVRIDEKSEESELRKIYLMNSSSLLNDSTTLNGSQFQQHDLYILKRNRELSFRIRFQERKNLNQYSSGLSRSYYRLNNFRMKFRMVEEINNQTDINFITDNNVSPAVSKRSREIFTKEFVSDFSYRPANAIEVGFQIKAATTEDAFPAKPTVIDLNSQLLRFTFAFLSKGRLRIELERRELISNTEDNYIPFEITRGNALGKNYLGRVQLDYRFANNLQASMNYLGRKQGGNRIIHSFRAEARAYF